MKGLSENAKWHYIAYQLGTGTYYIFTMHSCFLNKKIGPF